jgi:hypothetical protein
MHVRGSSGSEAWSSEDLTGRDQNRREDDFAAATGLNRPSQWIKGYCESLGPPATFRDGPRARAAAGRSAGRSWPTPCACTKRKIVRRLPRHRGVGSAPSLPKSSESACSRSRTTSRRLGGVHRQNPRANGGHPINRARATLPGASGGSRPSSGFVSRHPEGHDSGCGRHKCLRRTSAGASSRGSRTVLHALALISPAWEPALEPADTRQRGGGNA